MKQLTVLKHHLDSTLVYITIVTMTGFELKLFIDLEYTLKPFRLYFLIQYLCEMVMKYLLFTFKLQKKNITVLIHFL